MPVTITDRDKETLGNFIGSNEGSLVKNSVTGEYEFKNTQLHVDSIGIITGISGKALVSIKNTGKDPVTKENNYSFSIHETNINEIAKVYSGTVHNGITLSTNDIYNQLTTVATNNIKFLQDKNPHLKNLTADVIKGDLSNTIGTIAWNTKVGSYVVTSINSTPGIVMSITTPLNMNNSNANRNLLGNDIIKTATIIDNWIMNSDKNPSLAKTNTPDYSYLKKLYPNGFDSIPPGLQCTLIDTLFQGYELTALNKEISFYSQGGSALSSYITKNLTRASETRNLARVDCATVPNWLDNNYSSPSSKPIKKSTTSKVSVTKTTLVDSSGKTESTSKSVDGNEVQKNEKFTPVNGPDVPLLSAVPNDKTNSGTNIHADSEPPVSIPVVTTTPVVVYADRSEVSVVAQDDGSSTMIATVYTSNRLGNSLVTNFTYDETGQISGYTIEYDRNGDISRFYENNDANLFDNILFGVDKHFNVRTTLSGNPLPVLTGIATLLLHKQSISRPLPSNPIVISETGPTFSRTELNLGGGSGSIIGAFYEVVTPVAGGVGAGSIAAKTPVVLSSGNQAMTVAQLTALDGNRDGKLAGNEVSGLNFWVDANENGLAEYGEITAVSGSKIIASDQYKILTAGNGKFADTSASPAPAGLGSLVRTVPSSNYASLRNSSQVFNLVKNGAWGSFTAQANDPYLVSNGGGAPTTIVGNNTGDNFWSGIYSGYANYFSSDSIVTLIGGNGSETLYGDVCEQNQGTDQDNHFVECRIAA